MVKHIRWIQYWDSLKCIRRRAEICSWTFWPVDSVPPGAAAAHYEDPGSLASAESPVQSPSHSGISSGKQTWISLLNLFITVEQSHSSASDLFISLVTQLGLTPAPECLHIWLMLSSFWPTLISISSKGCFAPCALNHTSSLINLGDSDF